MDRLSIIDPNNPSNDISGGSKNTSSILQRFDEAYELIKAQMSDIANQKSKGGILDVIMKGDYSSFRLQRSYLRHVHEQVFGPCVD